MLGVKELTEGVVGPWAIDGSGAALHEEGHSDRFGRFLLARTCPDRATGVSGDAAIALSPYGQREGNEFLRLGRQGTFGHGA